MKNLFLTFTLAILAFGVMSFSSTEKFEAEATTTSTTEATTTSIITIEVQNSENENYPCKWRTCFYEPITYRLLGCTEWTYGEYLDEVIIEAPAEP